MHRIHIFISCINIFCGAIFILGLILHGTVISGWLIAPGMVGGYIANIFTVIISFFLFIVFIVRLAQGKSRIFLARHWLGIFNGSFIVLFWGFIILMGWF